MALGSIHAAIPPEIIEFDAGSISLSAIKKERLLASSSIVFILAPCLNHSFCARMKNTAKAVKRKLDAVNFNSYTTNSTKIRNM
jgi:hypothetical protein